MLLISGHLSHVWEIWVGEGGGEGQINLNPITNNCIELELVIIVWGWWGWEIGVKCRLVKVTHTTCYVPLESCINIEYTNMDRS